MDVNLKEEIFKFSHEDVPSEVIALSIKLKEPLPGLIAQLKAAPHFRPKFNISEIESKFGIEDFFQITSKEEVDRLQAEKGRLSQQLSGHLKQWEISSQNLENAKEQFDL